MGTSQERRPCRVSNATRTGPLSEAMPACRGRRADHAQKDRVGTWEIPRSARAIPLLVRIGKGKPKADDERTREVGPSSSSYKAGEQGGAIRRGAGGAKGWDQGECKPAAHGPDAEPGNRVTGAGAHTSNRKTAVCRHSPEVGAVCGKAARTDPRVSDLIQSGKLRVGIGLGTPLAVKNPTTGEVRGPTIDLGWALSARIGIDLVAIEYPRPGAVIEAAGSNAWDVAFLVVDANRAKQADFSQPYLQTDSTYLVLADSSIHNAADADQPGIRIAVPRGDGSDLELTRVLKRAELVRTDTIDAALELVRVGSAHGRAGPRPGPACGVSQAARLSRS